MSYINWMLKKGPKGPVIAWFVCVISGSFTMVGLFVWWFIVTYQYLVNNIEPSKIAIYVAITLVSWIIMPATVIYLFVDRELSYEGYLKSEDWYQAHVE